MYLSIYLRERIIAEIPADWNKALPYTLSPPPPLLPLYLSTYYLPIYFHRERIIAEMPADWNKALPGTDTCVLIVQVGGCMYGWMDGWMYVCDKTMNEWRPIPP